MKRTDVLLRLLAAADGDRLTPVQLQKVAFLVGMRFRATLPEDYYSFEKHDFGPFCAQIYRDAEGLASDGLVAIDRNYRGGWNEYSATSLGRKLDFQMIPASVSAFLDEKVAWARGLSFRELVREVYRQYPDYRENSVFQSW